MAEAAPQYQTMVLPDGEEVDVPMGAVGEAYRSGQAQFRPGDSTYFKTTKGDIIPVPVEQAGAILEGRVKGFRDLATPQQYWKNEEKKHYESVPEQIKTGGLSALSGATVGLSDYALTKVGGDAVREDLAKGREYNPGINIAWQISGALLPLALSGGSSAAVQGGGLLARGAGAAGAAIRTVGAPVRAIDAIGAGASALTRSGLGALGVAEGGALARVTAATARGAVEGGLYGVGQAISDASLKGDDITAEKLIAGFGHGALTGGVAMGGITGLGVAGRALGGKAVEAGGALLSRVVGEEKVLAKQAELAEKLGTQVSKSEAAINTLLMNAAETNAVRSLGGTQKMVEALEGRGDLVARGTKMLVEDLPEVVGKKSFAGVSKTEMVEGLQKVMQKSGPEVSGSLKQIDAELARLPKQAQVEAGANLQRIVDKAHDAVTPLFENALNKEGLQRKFQEDVLQPFAKRVFERGDNSLEGLWEIRRRLDKDINFEKMDFGGNEIRKRMRQVIESEIESVASTAAAASKNPELAIAYKTAKDTYEVAASLHKLAERGATGETRNAIVGLKEMFGGGTASTVGATIGAAALGAPGAAIGGALGGLIGAGGSHLFRKYGNQMIATASYNAAQGTLLSGVIRAAEDRVGKNLVAFTKEARLPSRGAVAVLTAQKYEVKRRADLDREFAEAKARIQAATSARIAQQTAEIGRVNPQLAAALNNKAAAGVSFLSTKIPARPAANPLQPGVPANDVSPAEKSKFLRYARAIDDPASVAEDVAAGKISREGVEALRTVYPALYSEMQARLKEQIAERKEPLTYAQKTQLAIVLGVPADQSFAPKNIQAVQAALTPAPAPQQPGPQTGTYKSSVASSRSRELGAFSERMKGEE